MKRPGDEYLFHYGEPGLFLELYVPEQYECFVKQTLDLAMTRPGEVKSYLSSTEHSSDIRKFLQSHEGWSKYSEDRVSNIADVLEGYSAYRGSGVFVGTPGEDLCRDSVVVFRMMFLPKLDKPEYGTRDAARFAARRYLRHWTHDESQLREAMHPNVSENKLLTYLIQWLDDIGLTMNGYLLHKLCAEILKRNEIHPTNTTKEREIWIGSFRCLAVNKVELRQLAITSDTGC